MGCTHLFIGMNICLSTGNPPYPANVPVSPAMEIFPAGKLRVMLTLHYNRMLCVVPRSITLCIQPLLPYGLRWIHVPSMLAVTFLANAESHRTFALQVKLQPGLRGLQHQAVTDVFPIVGLRSLPPHLPQPLPEWDTLRLSTTKGAYRAQNKVLP